jgi:uncharacterized protein (TIGR03083 family)
VLLTPRYDGPPVLAFEGTPGDALAPLVRQRRRLESILGALDGDQWAAPSRCGGWRVLDVVAHLVSTNAFWRGSVQAGLAGTPTTLLARFDPAATPPQLIEGMAALGPAEMLDRFVASDDGFLATVAGLDDAGWAARAEAPPGHVPVRVLCLHALWDSWVHERDIVLPLGLVPTVEADEVRRCVRYAAALSPAVAVSTGGAVADAFAVEVHGPDDAFVLEVGEAVAVRSGGDGGGAPCLRGDAVEVTEALSVRAPLPAGTPEAWCRLLDGGLATIFDAGTGRPAPAT